MALTCLLYGAREDFLPVLLQVFRASASKEECMFQIAMQTDSYSAACRFLQRNQGMLLLAICVPPAEQADEFKQALQLGRFAGEVNRNSYVVYCAANNRTMVAMAPYCPRAAGIISEPLMTRGGYQLMRAIFRDYHALQHAEAASDGAFVNLKVKGAITRIPMRQICAVMANNKMVEICTTGGKVQAYTTLEKMQAELDERFVRCHRSCLINQECIQYVDLREGNIVLMDGTSVPLSRNFKKAINDLMDKKEAASGQ